VAGGAKIKRQAETIGWQTAFHADTVSDEELQRAFAYCLTDAARATARECASRASQTLNRKRQEFLGAFAG
jgi:hypothetical protein